MVKYLIDFLLDFYKFMEFKYMCKMIGLLVIEVNIWHSPLDKFEKKSQQYIYYFVFKTD